jgi:cobalamin-dependent methionine synthase I
MVCVEILQKGMSHIGNLWFHNKATVQQEHFTSAKAIKQLNTLVAAAPQPTRQGRLIIACPPHDEHTFSPLLLTLLLRHQGWHVIYLGANLPIAQLKSTVDVIQPDLVIFAAQQLETAATLAKATQLLSSLGIPSAFGGAVFNHIPSLSPHINGHFLGETIDGSVEVVNKLMTFTPPAPQVKPLAHNYEAALNHFDSVRYRIDFDIRQKLEQDNIPFKYLEATNSRLRKDILAGLSLGNLSLINPELAISQQLMHNFGIPTHLQHKYFHAYHQAAKKHLHTEGHLIINWLENLRTTLYNSSAQI